MSILQQPACQMEADEACRSRNEVAHFYLFLGRLPLSGNRIRI